MFTVAADLRRVLCLAAMFAAVLPVLSVFRDGALADWMGTLRGVVHLMPPLLPSPG